MTASDNPQDYPIRLHIGSEYAKQAATFGQAVAALRGGHESGYHDGENVYVVRTWPETTFVPGGHGKRDVTYQQGEPLFGYRVTCYPRSVSFGAPTGARVSGASHSGSPDEMSAYMDLLNLAIQLARAANQGGCDECAEQMAEREARLDEAMRAAEETVRNGA